MVDHKTERTSSLAETFITKPWLFPLAGLGIGAICSCVLIAGMLLVSGGGPRLGDLSRQLTVLFAAPTPTPQCVEPALTMGDFRFRIEPIAPQPDGSLVVPENTPDVAYWVEGTETNYVFALSPAAENLALQAKWKAGDPAAIIWANCNSTTYVLFAPEIYPADSTSLFDQPASAITVYLQPSASNQGFVVQGQLESEYLEEISTASPDEAGREAEIELLESNSAPDGATITVSLFIYNYGKSPLNITAQDFYLITATEESVQPIGTDPGLPLEIGAGKKQTIELTFPKPAAPPAVLHIFGYIDYEITDN